MNETEMLATELGQCLTQRGWCITTAESCTGGGLAQTITSIAGSSQWFEMGFVTYSNRAKQKKLNISDDLLKTYGAVSEQVVTAMATNALLEAQADVAVAISGIAGPDGGTPQKPVGTIWVAWAIGDDEPFSRLYQFSGSREQIRQKTVIEALWGLNKLLKSTV